MAKIWTSEDEAYLIEHYEDTTNAELAELYEVTPKAISHKMRRLRDRMKKEQLKLEKEIARQKEIQKKAEEEIEIFYEEEWEPLNLPKIEAFEKMVFIDGSPMDLISTGFFVKTPDGWTQIMMSKEKVLNM